MSLRQSRVAVSAIFFVHGAVFASWAARVPAVKGELDMSAGVLGLVLAGPGLGGLAGSQVGGLLVRRLGSRTVSAMAPVVLCVPLGLVPFGHSAWLLMAVLVLLGAADGCTSVAMNAQAVVVQRGYGRSVLNSMHATRSVGAVAGGLAGVVTAAVDLALTSQFVVMAVLLAVVSGVAAQGLQPEPARPDPLPSRAPRPTDTSGGENANANAEEATNTDSDAEEATNTDSNMDADAEEATNTDVRAPVRGPRSSSRTDSSRPDSSQVGGRTPGTRLAVSLLALMTFLAALVEDAPASWSGVYLHGLGANAATAAAGYAAFSAGEVLTRLGNDWLVDRLGWARLIRGGTACCAAALAIALFVGQPGLALAAFFVAGAGISAVFPGVFSAAGALPGAALAMGQVGFAGNAGWLLVSPLIGGLATVAGLPAALGLLVAASIVIAGLASRRFSFFQGSCP